jgi:hypothetical protein
VNLCQYSGLINIKGDVAKEGFLPVKRCCPIKEKQTTQPKGNRYDETINPDSSGPALKKPLKRFGFLNGSLAHSIERTFKITVSLGNSRRGKPYVPILADL